MTAPRADSLLIRDVLVVTPRACGPIGQLDVRIASIGIDRGTICAIGPYDVVKSRCLQVDDEIDGREGDGCRYLAMPGFVDGHNHSRQTALRAHCTSGWGLEHLRPQTRQEMVALFRWFLLDALKAGVTFVCDWPVHPGLWDLKPMDRILARMGLRGCLRVLLPHDRDEPLPDVDEAARRLHRTLARSGDAVQLAVRIPEEDKPLFNRRALRFFGKLQQRVNESPVVFQMHLAESRARRQACKRAIDRLVRAGLIEGLGAARTVFVHAIWMGKRDIQSLVARRDRVGVITCPKFSDGRLAPVKELLRKGVPVGLGSDVSSPDPFALIRNVVLLHQSREESKQLSLGEAFHMATLGGATVFGLQDRIGSIEEGKTADLVLVRNAAAMDVEIFQEHENDDEAARQKRIDTVARLFMRNVLRREHVDTVIVGGKVILRNGSLTLRRLEKRIERAGKAAALTIMKRASTS